MPSHAEDAVKLHKDVTGLQGSDLGMATAIPECGVSRVSFAASTLSMAVPVVSLLRRVQLDQCIYPHNGDAGFDSTLELFDLAHTRL